MRKALTITAATVLSLGVLGGGVAVASNGGADQDRNRTQTCSQDCNETPDRFGMQYGMENGQRSGVQERQRSHERDGTGEQYQHQYRNGAQSGDASEGAHHFGTAGTGGGGDCQLDTDS